MFGAIPKDLFRIHDWRYNILALYLNRVAYIMAWLIDCVVWSLLCYVDNLRNDVVTIGHVPAELVQEASDGKVNEPWPAQINSLVRD